MLAFDIHHAPPTIEQIAEERNCLVAQVTKGAGIAYVSVSAGLIFLGSLCWWGSVDPIFTRTLVIAWPLATIGLLYNVPLLDGLTGIASGVAPGVTLLVYGQVLLQTLLDLNVNSNVTDSTVALFFVLWAVAAIPTILGAIYGSQGIERIRSKKEKLAGLKAWSDTDPDGIAKDLEACQRNVLCESYRLAVARQERPLLVAEAEMMVTQSETEKAEDPTKVS